MKQTIILLYTLLSISLKPAGQCISTSFVNGSQFTTDNSLGSYNFSVAGNAQVSDNSRASAASIISVLSGDTYYLKVTGFNFNIPSYASVCGITVEIESRATGLILTAAVRDNQVRLIKGGIITGDNKAKAGDWGNTDAYRSFGGALDLWGTSLTPADVNAADFGVAVSASIIALVAALPSAEIDHVRMKVDYNPLLPVHLLYFNGTKTGSGFRLHWKTSNEEENGMILLQRTANRGADWTDLQRFEQSQYNTEKKYSWDDTPTLPGEYAYRLRMSSAAGAVYYSPVVHLQYSGTFKLSLYPNPASSYVILQGVSGAANIILTDISGRIMKAGITKSADQSVCIRLESLPEGLYLLHAGNTCLRLYKK